MELCLSCPNPLKWYNDLPTPSNGTHSALISKWIWKCTVFTLFMCSLECYFAVYFPGCSGEHTHKQYPTPVHILFSIWAVWVFLTVFSYPMQLGCKWGLVPKKTQTVIKLIIYGDHIIISSNNVHSPTTNISLISQARAEWENLHI